MMCTEMAYRDINFTCLQMLTFTPLLTVAAVILQCGMLTGEARSCT